MYFTLSLYNLTTALEQYSKTLGLLYKIDGDSSKKKEFEMSVRAITRLKNGTIAAKTKIKWARRVYQFFQKDEISAGLLYNITNLESLILQGIEKSNDPRIAPNITNEEIIKQVIRKQVECPIRSRHLTKKAFHVLIEILQYKRDCGVYESASSQLPISQNITNIRAKGYIITWVVGVGKTGKNPHVHYLIIPPSGKNKKQMLKDLKGLKLNLKDAFTYLRAVDDFDSFAVYMAENYMEEAKPRVLRQGQRRFGISTKAKRLTKEQKQVLHPRFTRAEMERWQEATEIYRKENGIDYYARRHWQYTRREEIREIAESLPLEYNYPFERVSGRFGMQSKIDPQTAHGGLWTVYDRGKGERQYFLECWKTIPYYSRKGTQEKLLVYQDLPSLLDEFSMPYIHAFADNVEDELDEVLVA